MARTKCINFVDIKSTMIAVMVAILFAQLSVAADAADHLFLSKKKKAGAEKNPIVEMDTNKGTIKIEIFADDAPITSKNFIDLIDRGFYNGLTFHRYVAGFCIQGGDPTGGDLSVVDISRHGFIDPATKHERTIPLEVTPKLKHNQAGMIAMARLGSDRNSASSQFYFTLAPASSLDGDYAVFGKVVDGLNIVRELRQGDKMTKVFVLNEAHK
jgi:peptidyl-prolyl cis-trans isomerase B (cyclophilin B)